MAKVDLPEKYFEAEREAKRFLDRMRAFRVKFNTLSESEQRYGGSPLPERSALRRASLDLTRALARMRKS